MKHFKKEEFACRHCGKNKINKAFMLRLDSARKLAGIPFKITSGYRCETHPLTEDYPQSSHPKGVAADIEVLTSQDRFIILEALLAVGFVRIGIGSDFIHIDYDVDKVQNVIWTYEV